jgi:hypothetical protein
MNLLKKENFKNTSLHSSKNEKFLKSMQSGSSFEEKGVSFRGKNPSILVSLSATLKKEEGDDEKFLPYSFFSEDKKSKFTSSKKAQQIDLDSKFERSSKISGTHSYGNSSRLKMQPCPQIVVDSSNSINMNEDSNDMKKSMVLTSNFSQRRSGSYVMKSVNERVFWSKDQLDQLWQRFKVAADKIKNKIVTDFQNIYNAVRDGDETYVLDRLHNKEFKSFYKIELSKNKMLEYMLTQNQPQMLMKVLQDPFYVFNKLYVFEFLRKLLSLDSREVKHPLSMREIKGLELDEHEELNIEGIHDSQLR